MLRGLFQTKSVDAILAASGGKHESLSRSLGPWSITLLGIGAIIGTGIFSTIGTAAAGVAPGPGITEDMVRAGAGPSLMLSFAITAVVCAFTALCYAEFASSVPISGSAYTYSYATLGEFVAWIIGWDLMLEYAIGNVAVAISWAAYFRDLMRSFGIHIPLWLATDIRSALALRASDHGAFLEQFGDAPTIFGYPIVFNLLAFAIVAVITVVLVWGVKESARLNAVMVLIKILVLIFFIGAALWFVPLRTMRTNWTPFQPQGWRGTMAGAAVVFFAYIGFDAVSTVAEETKNPGRDLPIGIFASLIICTLFYIAIVAVFAGLIPFPKMQALTEHERAESLTVALRTVAPDSTWVTGIVAFGAVMATTAVLLVYQMGQPRIFFSMARDGLLPPLFAKVHPKYKTPHVTTILTGAIVGLVATEANIDEMVSLTNIGTLFAFVLVCLGIPILRYKNPDLHRPFRVPLGPFVLPGLGVASCLGLMYYLPPASWWRFAGWLVLGMAVYASYGYSHSFVGKSSSRPARTPAGLHVAGVGFLVAAAGMFVVPHERALSAELRDVVQVSAKGHQRAIWGLGLIVLGAAASLAGSVSGLRVRGEPTHGESVS